MKESDWEVVYVGEPGKKEQTVPCGGVLQSESKRVGFATIPPPGSSEEPICVPFGVFATRDEAIAAVRQIWSDSQDRLRAARFRVRGTEEAINERIDELVKTKAFDHLKAYAGSEIRNPRARARTAILDTVLHPGKLTEPVKLLLATTQPEDLDELKEKFDSEWKSERYRGAADRLQGVTQARPERASSESAPQKSDGSGKVAHKC